MKTVFSFLLSLVAFVSFAQPLPPPAASQAEANAGVNTYKYISPATLSGFSLNQGNGVTKQILTNTSWPQLIATNYLGQSATLSNATLSGQVTTDTSATTLSLSMPSNSVKQTVLKMTLNWAQSFQVVDRLGRNLFSLDSSQYGLGNIASNGMWQVHFGAPGDLGVNDWVVDLGGAVQGGWQVQGDPNNAFQIVTGAGPPKDMFWSFVNTPYLGGIAYPFMDIFGNAGCTHFTAYGNVGPSASALTAAGTGATTGLTTFNDTVIQVTLTTGTGTTAGGVVQVNYENPMPVAKYNITPYPVITAADVGGAGAISTNLIYVTSDTAKLTINAGLPLKASTTFTWNIFAPRGQ